MSDVPASTFTPAPMDSSKRTWLIASSCAGAAGAAALATPFVTSFAPSERAKAAGAAVEVDIASLKPGEKLTVEWRGKPVWIMRRTPEQMATLKGLDGQLADPNSERTAFPTPDYARNEARARQEHPELLVVVGICTTWAARRSTSSRPAPSPRCPTTGRAASSAPAMAPPSTWPVACSRTSPRPTTLKCRPTPISPTPGC